MTTQKTLRKMFEFIALNSNFQTIELTNVEIVNLFAKYFYPRTFKIFPLKAVKKTLIDIEVCNKLDYIIFDSDASILEDFVELSKKGAARIENKSDSFRNLLVRLAFALGGIASTVGASFLIDLIKSLLQ
jgi:hypothetical protein|nr:MAG TPA: hypothetical protein [Caudoviricetes sp.]